MNYYFTGILIILFCLLCLIQPAYPDSTQTNASGSNTAIEGGYTSSSSTTYQSGSSSNTTSNSTNHSNIKSCCIILTKICNSINVTNVHVAKPIKIVPNKPINIVLVFLVI